MKTIILQELIGRTFYRVQYEKPEERIIFKSDYKSYALKHDQLCCSSAWVEDITGDLSDLEGSPVILAEKRMDITLNEDKDGYIYWVFYEIATNKGSVTIRFCAPDNYYSISVDLFEVTTSYDRINAYDDIQYEIENELWVKRPTNVSH